MPSQGLSKYIETELQTTLSQIKRFFFKNGLELVSLPPFLHDFWRKVFPWLYSFNWLNLTVWLSLIREILDNMCIEIVC